MVRVRQSLKASGFSDGEIAYRTVILDHHVLAARYAVISGFERLGGLIKRAASMPRIHAGTVLKDVVCLAVRFAETGERIAHGDPWLPRWRR